MGEQVSVIYLSYDGLTDPLGQSQILPYACGLSGQGYSITLVTFEKRSRYEQLKGETKKVCDAHNIRWVPLPYHRSPPVLSAMFDLLILKRTVLRIWSEEQFVIVHCRSYLTSLVGVWAKKRFGAKFIFDMRGFWADERVEGGLWNTMNPLFKGIYFFFKKQEKRFLREADHVVSLTENARREIMSWRPLTAPVTVIPTCVDMELFDPGRHRQHALALRKDLAFGADDFILVYNGSWGTWYLHKEMLDFFSVLASVRSDARFLILTPDQPDLKDYPHASRVVVRHVSRQEVPSYLLTGNATICFIRPSYSKKASSATKVAEAWAMNLPVVTNPGWGDIDSMDVHETPLYICATPDDYRSTAHLVIRHQSGNTRDALAGTFDLASGVRKYNNIYRSLAGL